MSPEVSSVTSPAPGSLTDGTSDLQRDLDISFGPSQKSVIYPFEIVDLDMEVYGNIIFA